VGARRIATHPCRPRVPVVEIEQQTHVPPRLAVHFHQLWREERIPSKRRAWPSALKARSRSNLSTSWRWYSPGCPRRGPPASRCAQSGELPRRRRTAATSGTAAGGSGMDFALRTCARECRLGAFGTGPPPTLAGCKPVHRSKDITSLYHCANGIITYIFTALALPLGGENSLVSN